MAELRAVGSPCGWRWLVLLVSVLCLARTVSAIEVYGPSELFIENGTEARLPCTFKSSEVTSTSLLAIWKFDAQSKGGDSVTIFYYTGGTNQHKNKDQFTGRISWAGDLNKRDVSVKIKNMQFIDNGTYECTVFNPPDVSGKPNKIKIRVVERENLPASNVPFLVGIICGVIGGILLIALLIFALVICKRKRSKKNYSGCSTTESLMSVKQPPRKSPGTEELVKPMPSAPIQGPVIYAQLDHSGKPSNEIIKSESVVYSNIRRLC
ncbi:myelin zero 1 isoform X2 [Pelobates cultripes]|uniref:Myelin protein P0 n=1 Tax=Pelobates cultripes TaxID=61616 RepID=A0AAD1QXJ0_PELCU|nr:myelin zero 1 isoform X2 [Pelobates cultripes]